MLGKRGTTYATRRDFVVRVSRFESSAWSRNEESKHVMTNLEERTMVQEPPRRLRRGGSTLGYTLFCASLSCRETRAPVHHQEKKSNQGVCVTPSSNSARVWCEHDQVSAPR